MWFGMQSMQTFSKWDTFDRPSQWRHSSILCGGSWATKKGNMEIINKVYQG